MKGPVPETVISLLSDHIITRMGLYFPKARWAELESKISAASESLGFADTESCIQWMLSSTTDQRQLEILAGCLTNGETYFFRENKSLTALTERAIPGIIRAHEKSDKRLRIWSAGCSTGEEAYTLAMLVSEIPGLRDWDVSVLGTDINRKVLKVAEAGLYEEWSFRGVDPAMREKYFTKEGKASYRVLPKIKNMVSFEHLNLIDDGYPSLLNNTSALDLILCRNVLMYFKSENVVKVIRKFHQSLLDHGWLLVSPVEISIVDPAVFTPVTEKGAVLHRKTAAIPAQPVRPDVRVRQNPPAKKKQDAPDETYAKAMDQYAAADYDGAIRAFSDLACSPNADIRVFLFLSRSYANKGMLPDAEKWCLRAITANKINPASLYLLALIRIEQKRTVEAIITLRKALYLEPDFVVAHYTLANLYHRNGKKDDAERHLRNALLILQTVGTQEELPESEGITAEKMTEMIASIGAGRRNNGTRQQD